jgi:hypothetical protein
MAESEGFEPSIRCRIHTFQACSFSHSDNSPNSVQFKYYSTAFFESASYACSLLGRSLPSPLRGGADARPKSFPTILSATRTILLILYQQPGRHLSATGREAYMISRTPAISYVVRTGLFYRTSNTNTCEIRVSSSGAEL